MQLRRLGVVLASITVAAGSLTAVAPAQAGTVNPTITTINTTPDRLVFDTTADRDLQISVETDEPSGGWVLDRATLLSCTYAGGSTCTPYQESLKVATIPAQVLQRRFINFTGKVPNVDPNTGLLNRHWLYSVRLEYTSPTGDSYTLSTSDNTRGSYCYGYCSVDFYGASQVSIDGPDLAPAGSPVQLSGKVSCFTDRGYGLPPTEYGYIGYLYLEYNVGGAWRYGGSPDTFDQSTGEWSYATTAATADWRASFTSGPCATGVSATHHVEAGDTPPPPPPEGLPGQPSLSVGAKTSSTVDLNWTPPSGTVTAYHWGWTSSSGLPRQSWDHVYGTPRPNPFTLTNLAPNTTYTMWFAAINGQGEGPRVSIDVTTNEAPGNPLPPPSVTSKPRHLLSAAYRHRVRISWWAPARTGGAPVTTYQVHRAQFNRIVSPRARKYTFTGLKRHKSYRFYVRARNAAGWSPWASKVVRTK